MVSAQITAPPLIPLRFKAEKWDKIIYLGRAIHDSLLHCVLSFDGRLNDNILNKAFRLSLDAEPVLGCRFVDKSRQPYWERKKDLDREGRVDIAEVNDAMQAALEYMVKPIDPCDGPQVQARLFRAKRDTLCLKINHMVADAGGVKEYIYLLSSIYRQLEKDPSYIPEVNSAGSRSRMQVVQHFIFWDKVKIVRRSFRDWKEAYFPVGNWSVPLQHLTQSQKTYVIRKIELQQFRVVRQYCKKYGVTVNDIMMAAMYVLFIKCFNHHPKYH
ncbi:Condensation domain-containing protein [Candidatus Electrothrix aarhusensis]|uniref:Condensation domain-containing protein n=1 Tax=Candidatus Electrothrix aarhusensis TaxID=1859131 RepID=A0A3S3QSE7_9BACT|nr:Condensation domain-containing protein [Candidatus Electrothrix aarhusensis]